VCGVDCEHTGLISDGGRALVFGRLVESCGAPRLVVSELSEGVRYVACAAGPFFIGFVPQ